MIKVIGLTGQTGAGKSEVCNILKKSGIDCIDCDGVSRDVTVAGSAALKALQAAFSDDILNPDGSLDRKKLGAMVFSDREKLELLNRTVFPFIIEEIKGRIAKSALDKRPVVVLDAPTLFESGCDKLCDETVAVIADRDIRLSRITKRDGLSEKEAENRIDSQLSEDFFRSHCDCIISNNGDIDELEDAVVAFLKQRSFT